MNALLYTFGFLIPFYFSKCPKYLTAVDYEIPVAGPYMVTTLDSMVNILLETELFP